MKTKLFDTLAFTFIFPYEFLLSVTCLILRAENGGTDWSPQKIPGGIVIKYLFPILWVVLNWCGLCSVGIPSPLGPARCRRAPPYRPPPPPAPRKTAKCEWEVPSA